MKLKWFCGLLLLAGLLIVACGGDDDDDSNDQATPVAEDESAATEEGAETPGEDDAAPPSAEGSTLSAAGFPSEFSVEAAPEVSRIATDDEGNRDILFGLQGLTTGDGSTEASFLLSAREEPADGAIECGGEELDGLVSEIEGPGVQPGLVEITPSGFLDLTLERAVGVFEDGDERVPICLEYSGTYVGASTDFEGLSGSFRVAFSDGQTTLTFD